RRSIADAPAAVQADCPDWGAPLLEKAFGDGWAVEGAALAARPPLDLRVNTLKATREKVLAELDGIDARSTEMSPVGIRIPPIRGERGHPDIQAAPAFRQAWLEVQGEGLQNVAVHARATPDMQLLTYCADAGGEAQALSAVI